MNDLIKNEFFYIDSNNIRDIESGMYGYSISLNDNSLKLSTSYEDNILSGQYIKITKDENNQIFIETDDLSSYYIFYYKNDSFWAVSNSFFTMIEKLKEYQFELTLDKNSINTLMQSAIRTYCMYDTFISEIKIVPAFYNIKLSRHIMEFIEKKHEIDAVDIDSEEGMSIIDNWISKWQNIMYNLVSSGTWTQIDVTGGFDSRTILSLLYSSGADLSAENVNIYSKEEGVYEDDFDIATKVVGHLGLKITNKKSPIQQDEFTGEQQYEIMKNYYMGFHKEGGYVTSRYQQPTIHFSGINGELVRGNYVFSDYYVCSMFMSSNPIVNFKDVYMNYVEQMTRLRKIFDSDFVAGQIMNVSTMCRSHFGMTVYSDLLSNTYSLNPFNDKDLLRIHIPDGYDKNMIYAMIIERTTPTLFDIKFNNGVSFKHNVIDKVKEISAKYPFNKTEMKQHTVIVENANEFVPDETVTKSRNELTYDKFVEGKQEFIDVMTKLNDRNYASQLYKFVNRNWLNNNSYYGNKLLNTCAAVIETIESIK